MACARCRKAWMCPCVTFEIFCCFWALLLFELLWIQNSGVCNVFESPHLFPCYFIFVAIPYFIQKCLSIIFGYTRDSSICTVDFAGSSRSFSVMVSFLEFATFRTAVPVVSKFFRSDFMSMHHSVALDFFWVFLSPLQGSPPCFSGPAESLSRQNVARSFLRPIESSPTRPERGLGSTWSDYSQALPFNYRRRVSHHPPCSE